MQLNPGPATELFFNPRNVGDAVQPSFVGRSASFTCGAALRISLHIDESQRITEAKFKAAGCGVLVASASLLTDQVIGQTTGEAAASVLARQVQSVEAQLGVLTPDKKECVALARAALVSAVASYSDSVRDEWNGDEALICTCFGVSERTIENEIQTNRLSTIAEVTKACNAGAGCGSCEPLIEDILEEVNRR